jgi:hypothetical protein
MGVLAAVLISVTACLSSFAPICDSPANQDVPHNVRDCCSCMRMGLVSEACIAVCDAMLSC